MPSDPSERSRLSLIAHRRHPVAAPFSDTTVELLLDDLAGTAADRVVDIGCGTGEWLVRLRRRTPCAVTGVDLAPALLEVAAERLGPGPGVELVVADAATWNPPAGPFHVMLCIGASHAAGGLAGTLNLARRLLREDGRLLLGDGYWATPPTPAALEALGADVDELPTLDGLRSTVTGGGFVVTSVRPATLEEFDQYERSWCGSLREFAAASPDDPAAPAAAALADEHWHGYEHGYRSVLGFAGVVAHRA